MFANHASIPNERKTIMPTRNINLTDRLHRFVERRVSSGHYSNASEIVREALRLLEREEQERQLKLKALRQAARKGFGEIEQGKGIVLKGKKAVKQFVAEIEAGVSSTAAKNGR
jgi:antitoxin ParD1/3/4